MSTMNGIAKVFKEKSVMKFVDIVSHNENLRKISESICEEFVGNRQLLIKAAAIHDLWKSATINPDALFVKRPLFKGHSSKFPASLVSKEFDDIEFNKSVREKHFDDYYILNLVRLHHSGFNTYSLYRNVDFIFENFEKDHWKIIESINAFIKDWYALMTADWIDSAIVGAVLNAEDLEFYVPSEISLGRKDVTEFNVLPENFLKTDVTLSYTYVEIPTTEVTEIIKNSRKRNGLNKEFLSRLENGSREKVRLHAT
ncbi:MAG: hypothetical protein ACBZ72_05840 [Candidatus Bathyarchaeia archaeon]